MIFCIISDASIKIIKQRDNILVISQSPKVVVNILIRYIEELCKQFRPSVHMIGWRINRPPSLNWVKIIDYRFELLSVGNVKMIY